jgi:hypothetical protein
MKENIMVTLILKPFKGKGMEKCNIMMVLYIKVDGKMINIMVLERSNILMVNSIKTSIIMDK